MVLCFPSSLMQHLVIHMPSTSQIKFVSHYTPSSIIFIVCLSAGEKYSCSMEQGFFPPSPTQGVEHGGPADINCHSTIKASKTAWAYIYTSWCFGPPGWVPLIQQQLSTVRNQA